MCFHYSLSSKLSPFNQFVSSIQQVQMNSVKILVAFVVFVGIGSCRRLILLQRKISYTEDGRNCITDCNDWSRPGVSGDWCRPNFEDWAACTQTDGYATDFYASQARTNQYSCKSDCVKGTDNKYRCLTDVLTAEQDFCSPRAGVSVEGNECLGSCEKKGKMFTCSTSKREEFCSPPPTEFFKRNIKKSKKCPTPPSTESLRLNRRGHDYFLRSMAAATVNFDRYYDIRHLVQQSENNNDVSTSHEQNRPEITFSSTMNAGVRVLRSLRARLTRDTIPAAGFSRAGHPDGVQDHMHSLNQLPSDEIGHVLGIWGGGANELINLVPQDEILNRNRGHTPERYSYWRMTEEFIQWLVRQANTAYVDIWFYVFYEGNLNERENRRPVGFGLRYIAHFNNGEIMDSTDCPFENNFDRGDDNAN